MRVLLDECVPRQLARELPDLDVRTVQQMGWNGIKNGALLERAAAQFDALFTVDLDLAQAFAKAKTKPAVVILAAGTTDAVKLKPHMAAVRRALAEVKPGELRRLDA
jgi:predicted nuclease of predicted toxin-antitoxin system